MHNINLHFGEINELLNAYLKENSFNKIFILVDENTKRDCLPLIHFNNFIEIEIKSGEQHKNIQTCQQIWAVLLEHEAHRNDLLINLGGGVIGDMGGFCASVFKRGISFVNIPTTLLAMVDASIGGKTGIDFYNQKNMLGVFNKPKAVLIDNIFLKTLPTRQLLSGKAEMLKHGIIANEEHFFSIPIDEIPTLNLIETSINIKNDFVKQDPYDKGLRKTLNFGHTLGHALESYCLSENYDLLHGEAVAQGMLWAIDLSVNFNALDFSMATRLKNHIRLFFKPLQIPNTSLKEIIIIAQNDKKNNDSSINFCLLKDISNPIVDLKLNANQVYDCLSD
ncbi:MAG: 3-dehydroquinate synthase [Bacteroidetes bacterium]|nr:3-dehydroquinate synthase [Bacteroidota bacterium]MCB9227265.1 3-dehydroquinate synthase [Chitinophagales bacterium]